MESAHHRAIPANRGPFFAPLSLAAWSLIAPAQRHLFVARHMMGIASNDARWQKRRVEMTTQAFRLRPIMKQGTASGIPETWTHYPSVEDARTGAKLMYQNDRVLRVMVVTDSVGSFVEWIER